MTDTLVEPTTIQSSDPDRTIPTRRLSFEESLRDLPRHFAADGNLIHSHLIAVLSSAFPDGEDFFVRSVRHYRDRITDPDLKRQVNGFIGQEATHGREHRVFNDRLATLGYPTKRLERTVRRGLAIRERIMTPMSNLAFTAALEHFTATLAELALRDPDSRAALGDDAVRNLLVWHALEESEHKAVAFDVYRAVGGSERTRVVTMKATRVGFVVGMGLQVVVSMLGDRATFERGNLRRSWRGFAASPLMSRSVRTRLRDYDRPGFHPNDIDTTALEDRWRTELFGVGGPLAATVTATAPGTHRADNEAGTGRKDGTHGTDA